ncbi:MAG: hypothetical protein ACLR9K_09365 [Blautia sp.]
MLSSYRDVFLAKTLAAKRATDGIATIIRPSFETRTQYSMGRILI